MPSPALSAALLLSLSALFAAADAPKSDTPKSDAPKSDAPAKPPVEPGRKEEPKDAPEEAPADAAKPGENSVAAAAAERKKLEGRWTMVRHLQAGKEVRSRPTVAVFEGDRLTLLDANRNDGEKAIFRVDPTAKPPTIDFLLPDGRAGLVCGIYTLVGDELTICFVKGGGGGETARPREVASNPDNGASMLVLKRERKP